MEKDEMIPLSKTDGFPRQRHVTPLKLRHVAPIFKFLFIYLYFDTFFKNKKIKNCRGG
jgi:hypothetical protein